MNVSHLPAVTEASDAAFQESQAIRETAEKPAYYEFPSSESLAAESDHGHSWSRAANLKMLCIRRGTLNMVIRVKASKVY